MGEVKVMAEVVVIGNVEAMAVAMGEAEVVVIA